jgi:hypothetical protein
MDEQFAKVLGLDRASDPCLMGEGTFSGAQFGHQADDVEVTFPGVGALGPVDAQSTSISGSSAGWGLSSSESSIVRSSHRAHRAPP